jgi:molybdopterin synthase catalytic subunit
MRLNVKLFASVREAVGKSEIQLDMPAGASVSQLLSALRGQYPQIGAGLEAGMVAVNQEYASQETLLADGDEVAVIPPVSGGAGVGSLEGGV